MKKKIILFLIFFVGLPFFSIANIDKKSSWISKIEYKVEWCHPKSWCKEWYFLNTTNNIWPVHWEWFVESSDYKVYCSKDTTSCTAWETNWTPFSPSWLQSFVQKKLRWEWVYTIKAKAYDNVKYWRTINCKWQYSAKFYNWDAPWNCAVLEKVVYKIDKVHPQIKHILKTNSSYSSIENNSKHIYAWRSTKKDTNVTNFDAIDNNDNDWNENIVIRWNNNNIKDNPSKKNVTRDNIKTIYYSKYNENLKIKLNLANYFAEDNNTNYLSELDKVSIIDNNHNSVCKSWSVNSIRENNRVWNGTINNLFCWSPDEKIFYLRLYDKAGNYTETPLYLIKDSEKPIKKNEIVDIFKFSDGSKVLYTENEECPNNTVCSKFFQANDNEAIDFFAKDDKEWWTNETDSWMMKIKVKIEKNNMCNNFKTYDFNVQDYWNQEKQVTIEENWKNIITNHDFSKVDKCTQDTNKTYRYYKVKFISIDEHWNEYEWEICDKVWNCLEVELSFRVVANKISEDNSKIKISTSNLKNNKLLANKESKYILQFELKDIYNNKIVPIFSQEDNEEIKNVSLDIDFTNWLYLNQINKNWKYWTFKKDLESDNKQDLLTTISKLEQNIFFSENPQDKPNWIYTFEIYSLIPTFEYYPWIWDMAQLILKKIIFKWENVSNVNNNIQSLWVFNKNKFDWPDTSYISLYTWNMWYKYTPNNYYTLDKNKYGQINENIYKTEDSLSNKWINNINFSFASPILVGFDQLKSLSEWVKNYYNYKIWNFDDNIISKSNIQLNEYWKSATFYELYQWYSDNILEEKWYNSTLKWVTNLINNFITLDIIDDFTSTVKNITKYTKLTIDQQLASFYDEDVSSIAIWTKLAYKDNNINNNIAILPSDGRWVNDNINLYNTKEYWDSLSILTWVFNITNVQDYDNNEIMPLIESIKVIWNLQAKWRVWNLQDIIKERHFDIWWDIDKWKVKNNVNKKISQIMRWRNWHNSQLDTIINNTNNLPNEAFNIENETIVPIEWNLIIWDVWIDKKITILVKDWSVYINDNIYKSNNNWILTIISTKTGWFEKNSIHFDSIKKYPLKQKWFIYINPKVTNIDAYIYTEWSVLSYEWTKIFHWWNTKDVYKDIYNQLYIRWGIISTNTIWWSRLINDDNINFNQKCPWFLLENDCNYNSSQAFDFIYLRRYMLVDDSYYGWNWNTKVPYIPVSIATWTSTYNNNHPYMWGKKYYSINKNTNSIPLDNDSKLKNIPISWKEYPLYIEYDTTIQQNRSIFLTP